MSFRLVYPDLNLAPLPLDAFEIDEAVELAREAMEENNLFSSDFGMTRAYVNASEEIAYFKCIYTENGERRSFEVEVSRADDLDDFEDDVFESEWNFFEWTE